MFQLTPAASRQIRASTQRSDAEGLALRVAARQVADGSLEYGMGFDARSDDDLPLDFEGLTVLVAAHHQPLLEDTVLDFVELQPGEFGFIFIPPRPEATAPEAPQGCGSGGCSRCAG
jgi:iron-sulfur cluster assembly protein